MIREEIERFLMEDGLDENFVYSHRLPKTEVQAHLFCKSTGMVAGLPFFLMVFEVLGHEFSVQDKQMILDFEGRLLLGDKSKSLFSFSLPFSTALNGERLALNLLAKASAVATQTNKLVKTLQKLDHPSIAVLDTRKTTPGLRFLEKYAVVLGGGQNHRMSQTDVWMIKDNHKKCFGSLKVAYEFFKNLKTFYNPIVVEIHNLDELQEAIDLGVKHFLLDNFSKEMLQEALTLKPDGATYEISGGISENNLEFFAKKGVDALSVGGLTNNPPAIDLSLKFFPKEEV